MEGLKRHGTQDGAAWCHLDQPINSKWDRTIVATTQPFSTWFDKANLDSSSPLG
jgi:hypothetical protein